MKSWKLLSYIGVNKMRRLYEWKLMSPLTSNNNSSAVDYKGKLKKLFDYHISKVRRTKSSCNIKTLKEDQQFINLEYEETSVESDGSTLTRKIIITYDKTSNAWILEVLVDGTAVVIKSGKTFNDLIDFLRPYVAGPLKGSTEDQEILEELGSAAIYEEFKEYESLWT
jgi:hypothetical protein